MSPYRSKEFGEGEKKTYFTPNPNPTSTIVRFFFSDNFAFHYADLLDTIDFLLLIKLNDGFDIDMLFRLVQRMFWIEIAAEFLNTPLDIKNEGDRYGRREFDFLGGHDNNADDF